MLTKGPAPDPKCKLNISSFLALLLDCLICARNLCPLYVILNDGRNGSVESG